VGGREQIGSPVTARRGWGSVIRIESDLTRVELLASALGSRLGLRYNREDLNSWDGRRSPQSGHSGTAGQRPFLALAGTRIASMSAASAGDTWRRPG
jgi:hypothetical protein